MDFVRTHRGKQDECISEWSTSCEWLPSKYTLSFYFSQTGFQEAYSTKVRLNLSYVVISIVILSEVVCDV